MTRPVVLVGLLVLLAITTPARGDTFLLKGGARVYGEKIEEYSDANKKRWVRVRTTFGHLNFTKSQLKKHLKSKRADGPLLVTEIVVTTLKSDVWKSADGKAWERLSPRTNQAKTWTELPVNAPNSVVAPGERLRTGRDGEADLDLGFGALHVRPGSELVFAKQGESSLRVFRGEGGLRLDGLPKRRRFVVETPQASLGVRGTTFLVRVGETTRVAVQEGVVDVGETSVGAGEAADVTAGEPPGSVGQTERDAATFERLRRTYAIPRLEWVLVPGGSYEMGGTRPENSPRHTVDVPEFRLSKFEITNAQFGVWLDFLRDHGDHYYCYPGEPRGAQHGAGPIVDFPWKTHPELVPTAPEQPVGGDSWHSAYGFCAWIGARLPSEAEWEYAARAGDKSEFPYGNSQKSVAEYEWIGWNSGKKTFDPKVERTRLQGKHGVAEGAERLYQMQIANGNRAHPPGGRRPNAFGIHDMLGNVKEFCMDVYHPNYDGAPTDGAAWVRKENLSTFGAGQRVVRGGHFLLEWGNPHSATWRGPIPGPIGFRPAADLRSR